MANTKISALTSATTPLAGTEVLPIVQSSATVKVAVSDLTAGRSVSGTSFVPTGSTVPANGLYLPATNSVGIATNTTVAVTVDASQNVGIGTTSPSTYVSNKGLALGGAYGTSSTALAIYNSTAFSASNIAKIDFRLNNSFTGTGPCASIIGLNPNAASNNGGALTFATAPNGTSTTPAEVGRFDQAGNLGIGTTSPSSYVTSNGLALVGGYGTSSTAFAIYNSTSPSASNTARIDFRLANSFSGTGPCAAIYGLNPNAASNNGGALVFATSVNGTNTTPTERMRIDNAGIVTMSAYGAGAATFSAAGVISSVSDETWKIKDGVPVDPDSMLKKLMPGYWYYNDEKKETFGSERQLGFYAQNVNAAIGPEAAPQPEEGKPWGYHDRSVLAVVVMSLQKALETIDSLTARIEALEG